MTGKICDHRPRPYTIIEDIVLESRLTSLQKLVLIVLHKYAGKQSSAWPGIETIARCASSSSRQIRRVIKDLKTIGLLKVEQRPGQSSIYHIPEYHLNKKQLGGVWNNTKTPDTMSPPTPDIVTPQPGHHVRGGRTSCHPTPDMVSPKQSQEQYQGTSLSRKKTKQKPPPGTPDRERENFFNDDLIADWSEFFSIQHRPVSCKEQTAMDWMLYAARGNQLGRIKSPVGYLKTITRKGFPQDFPTYRERLKKSPPSCLDISVEQRWNNLNPVQRQLYIEEAREKGSAGEQLEKTAFKLFLTSLVEEPKQPQNTPCTNPPIKSPPTPHFEPC